jgi:WhiB family redox-sensing transcriptional regulator
MVDEPEAWRKDAACLETPYVNFFPGRGELTKATKAVCDTCLVRAECLEYAIANEEVFGIWGGTSERQRRQMRKAIRDANGIKSRGRQFGDVAPAACGTSSGYERHRREKTTPCAACRAARTRQAARYREERRLRRQIEGGAA